MQMLNNVVIHDAVKFALENRLLLAQNRHKYRQYAHVFDDSNIVSPFGACLTPENRKELLDMVLSRLPVSNILRRRPDLVGFSSPAAQSYLMRMEELHSDWFMTMNGEYRSLMTSTLVGGNPIRTVKDVRDEYA